jgi:hypothetical protein
MLNVILTLLDKRAVVSGAGYAVRIRKHASTDALASIYINRNRLKEILRDLIRRWT